jgi:hypothetical protein
MAISGGTTAPLCFLCDTTAVFLVRVNDLCWRRLLSTLGVSVDVVTGPVDIASFR